MRTLLGHLAFCRLTTQVEDLATEALGYILGTSETSRSVLRRHVGRCGVVLPERLAFVTQAVGVDEERPDIVGRSSDGVEHVLIEAKFWAGLTDNQPIRYLDRLPQGGVLLFVVPDKRLHSCWSELLVRCDREHRAYTAALDVAGNDMPAASLHGDKRLALTTWRRLLDEILNATRDSDALFREAGAIEPLVLPHAYSHLAPLVGVA
jgi:hypothetical protein